MKKIEELVSQPVRDFVVLSQKYCTTIEVAGSMHGKEMQEFLLKILPRIYVRILTLPEVTTVYTSDTEKFLTEKEYKKVYQSLQAVLRDEDTFTEIADDKILNKEILVRSSMSEALTDIYQDLKDFIKWYSFEDIESKNDAIAEIERSFRQFWGVKLLFLLRALHALRFNKKKVEVRRTVVEDDDEQGFDPAEMEGFSEDRGNQ